jgi:hypothetical protein
VTDGNGKARISPGSALPDQTRLQQQYFPAGMQFGQAAGAGQTRHTGPDNNPGNAMGSAQRLARLASGQEFRPAMPIRGKVATWCHG